ncbi:DEAD/DEAH box helicase [Altererythrobacter sp. CC-YST694]|uniref:DEAD/DEAH box helicase n=1 Tax=Altererythrobacter sp. CC-YST694 TaxID=2755038 RepID=UPI001D01BFD8|nr:DEAD/DEAH box helicase [Altererythrobacter sp. CC-YST694]MCB5425444.1 DEAD/DEAH box helicase [Altererythrobacter sp. CC-YST694]
MSYFSELGLAEPILRALNTKGYSDPTPIQRQAIPALLEGRDLLGIAQTGTGKTAAFSLPSLHRLAENPVGRFNAGCRMLVLSPTRELAAQIAENMKQYARFLDLSVQCVFGGVPVGKQARALMRGCDILVATPGRLLDLIDQRALTLRHVEIFVLDEADQMMDLGFIKPLTRVAALLPEKRQSLFFSATMPKAIAELGKRFIKNPVRVEVAPQATTAERVEQYSTFVDQKEKQALLTLRLRETLNDGSLERTIVFTRTKHGADRVVRHLSAAGIDSAAIHGNKSQAQRIRALESFRQGHVKVLVATDIAARGIDVSGVSHVFNFELPNVPEQYVHRIGRTARAGADGIAMSFVAPDEKAYLRDIEKLTGVKLTPMPLPESFRAEMARLPLPPRAKPEEEREEGRGDRRNSRDGRGQRRGGEGRGENRGERRGSSNGGGTANGGGQRRDAERREAARKFITPRHPWPNSDESREGKQARSGNSGAQQQNGARAGEQRREGRKGPARAGESRTGERRGDARPDHRGERRQGEQRHGGANRGPRNEGRTEGRTEGRPESGQRPQRRRAPRQG